MLKKLILSLIFLFAVASGFFVSNTQNHSLAVSNNWSCKWQDASDVECRKPSGPVQLANGVLQSIVSTLLANPISSWPADKLNSWLDNVDRNYDNIRCVFLTGVCNKFFYMPSQSLRNGYPTYCWLDSGSNNYVTTDRGSDEGCLHFLGENPILPWHTHNNDGRDGSAKIITQPANSGTDDSPNYWSTGGIDNANKVPFGDRSGACSYLDTGDNISCHIGDHTDALYNGAGMNVEVKTRMLANIEQIQALAMLKKACNDNAPLPFITCPIYEAILTGISNLIGGQGVSGERDGLLINFLTIEPLKSQEGVNVFQQIVGNVVVVANFFYVIVFLVLIFSSSLPLGLDNYTIKKTLPKFIAAVIMTQFAYVICGVIVDFFNLLGTIIPNMIFALRTISPTLGLPTGNGGAGLQAGLAGAIIVGGAGAALLISQVGWILIFILALLALVAILVAFVFIVLRMIVLYVLILISPIAFASWVLPGTEKFFSTWWKNFIRLNAMFPLITGMLAVSILLSRVLVANPSSGTSGGALTLVAMVIPIVALLAIPKTLKWVTAGMSALAGGMMGAVAGKVHNAGAGAAKKGTQMAKSKGVEFGKNRAVQAVANNPNSKMAVFLGGTKKAQQEVGKMTSENRANAANKYAASGDVNEIGRQTRASIAKSQKNPSDLLAKADAQAGLARLNQLGGGGRNEIASAQDAFRNQGGSDGAWKGMIGDAGIIGDLDTKAPELTGWGAGATNFTDQTTNGETYKVRGSGVDIKGKGAPALGKLGAGSVWNVANATNKNTQFGDGTAANTGQINWQAAASMAKDTQMHPEDAEAISAWKEIGRQGVTHWESIGNAAAASGNTAAFDAATANQLHAQAILDGFGG
ncbi:MAG: hypothetical protein WCN86_01535 [bacterium]